MFFRVIVTVLQIIFYSVAATLFFFPFALDLQSLPPIILRAVSILVYRPPDLYSRSPERRYGFRDVSFYDAELDNCFKFFNIL